MEMIGLKRSLVSILAIILLMSAFTPISNASVAKVISVYVDGKKVAFDVQPIMENNRVLVPLRGVFEALGATVEWNDKDKSILAEKAETTLSLTVGDAYAVVNKEMVNLDVPSKNIGGRTFVPLRFVAESFNAKVTWDANTNTVAIESTSFADVASLQYLDGVPEPKEETKGAYGAFDSLVRYYYDGNIYDEYLDLLYKSGFKEVVKSECGCSAIYVKSQEVDLIVYVDYYKESNETTIMSYDLSLFKGKKAMPLQAQFPAPQDVDAIQPVVTDREIIYIYPDTLDYKQYMDDLSKVGFKVKSTDELNHTTIFTNEELSFNDLYVSYDAEKKVYYIYSYLY
jgi:hypothetical protein